MAGLSSTTRGAVALCAIWLIGVGLGMVKLLDYDNAAAEPASPPAEWPLGGTADRLPGRPTLVMLAHPHCPCTRATLGELEIVAARTQGLLDIHVIFLRSEAFDYRSDLWYQARALPGAQVIADASGAEIRRFGAIASGHVLVYDSRGRLSFSGGITSSRGHAGGNIGRDAVIALAQTGVAEISTSPVFGCALRERTEHGHRR
jgi:hypothetical protein